MNDKAREAFEAHASLDGRFPEVVRRGKDDEYTNPFTHSTYRAWDAALQWAASQQEPKTAEEMRPDFEWWWQTRGIFPPLGTREAAAAWGAWLASGGYKAPSDWKLSPAPWGWDEAVAASQQAAEGWVSVHDRLPILPEDCEDDGVKVYTWDGEFVTEDVFEPQYEQPAGPAVGGWLRTGDWFCSDTATRVTHWMPRNPPAPPATQGGTFRPGEYERMTENGRKAWEGVDPQDLRAGNFPQGGEE